MHPIRTDLAMESFENAERNAMPGVRVSRWESGGIDVTEVVIDENAAARELGKPRGAYLTLEHPGLRRHEPEVRLAMANLLGEELARLLPEDDGTAPTLVVGLGNREITPDALGPGVVDRTLVTRHMLNLPGAQPDLRSVCAIAPGVLGVTGIETLELVENVARALQPRAVICIDSLAARDSRRIGSTIQLSDSGIQPGAGVGNHRRALTEASVGAPVIAIGMPTVIYAATLARDAFAWLSRQDGGLDEHEAALADMERALLRADVGEMIVTPREIDTLIQDAAGIIATGINRALQPSLSEAEIAAMMD